MVFEMKRKTHLSVEECMKIYNAPESPVKSLALLILTTGIHASCITEWKKYNLHYDKTGITWERTKRQMRRHSVIHQHWRAPMREKNRYKTLGYWKRKTRYWLHDALKQWGEEIGVKGLCPLLLRRAYFINHGRLNTSPMDLEHESRTRWHTIIDFYTYGKREQKSISQKELDFLKWLYN